MFHLLWRHALKKPGLFLNSLLDTGGAVGEGRWGEGGGGGKEGRGLKGRSTPQCDRFACPVLMCVMGVVCLFAVQGLAGCLFCLFC